MLSLIRWRYNVYSKKKHNTRRLVFMGRIKQANPEQEKGGTIAHSKSGFTLIELLVVISIIALLMAILLPVLQRAKGQAKAVFCKSNMRQIGIAANLYANAWDSYVPRGEQGKNTWFIRFMPYLSEKPIDDDYRNVKMYRCPSYPDKEQTVCYVCNAWHPRYTGHSENREQILEPTKLNSYFRLASTIYLAENEYGHWRDIIRKKDDPGWDYCDVWEVDHLPRATESLHNTEKAGYERSNSPRVARNRHGRGSNCLFADWHVELMTGEELAGKTKTGEINKSAIDLWRFKTK